MTNIEILKELNEIFIDIFDDESIVVNEQTTAKDIEDWDSLEHINLIVAVEENFSMKFTMGEVSSMQNVGEMVEIISLRI